MTWQGSVVSINIAPGKSEPMEPVDSVDAVAGKGLVGDRYYDGGEGRDLTLIEAEAIEQLEAEAGLKLAYADARRNIVTKGVALNDLVDVTFTVGDVTVRGVRLSEPCQHLADLTDQRVIKGLVHKGGLKAEILTDGSITVGDIVQGS